jgi:hypothetical protein
MRAGFEPTTRSVPPDSTSRRLNSKMPPTTWSGTSGSIWSWGLNTAGSANSVAVKSSTSVFSVTVDPRGTTRSPRRPEPPPGPGRSTPEPQALPARSESSSTELSKVSVSVCVEKVMTSLVKTTLAGLSSGFPPRSAINGEKATTTFRLIGALAPAEGNPEVGLNSSVVIRFVWSSVSVKLPSTSIWSPAVLMFPSESTLTVTKSDSWVTGFASVAGFIRSSKTIVISLNR